MPAFLASPVIGAVIGGGISAGAGLYGAHKQQQGNDRAAALQYKATQDAIALERERDAEARRQFDAKEALMAPYRQMSATLAGQYARYYGLPGGGGFGGGSNLRTLAAPRDVLTPRPMTGGSLADLARR